jgi:ABC-type sugar transport system ATPase subunit
MSANPAIYVASGIDKRYGGVTALSGVDLELHSGEIHSLVGANGAGKSTLMKILAGAERPTAGHMALAGSEVEFSSVRQASAAGVAIVSQELSLFPHLTVLANLFLLREPRRRGVVDRGAMRARARPVTHAIGLDVPLDTRVGDLRLGERQLVEIARALIDEPRVLILDEPTASLVPGEVDRLHTVIRRLRDHGVAVVYVSHFLEDVFAISDAITVVRDGLIVCSRVAPSATTVAGVVEAMLGAPPPERVARMRRAGDSNIGGGVALRGVCRGRSLLGVDLSVERGEIVGLAGLDGSGVSTVFDVLFGVARPDAGEVMLPDGGAVPGSIAAAVRRGVALVPADRKATGLMLDKPIVDNITNVSAIALGRAGFRLSRTVLRRRAHGWRERLGIRTPTVAAPANTLSGGNQQKVVFAKWLDADAGVYLLDDPTRGVDIGAKQEVHDVIRSLADKGAVIIVSSSDPDELAELADRVVVFFRGRVAATLAGDDLTEHALLEAMNTGIAPAPAAAS